MSNELLILIPALNEAATIGDTIREVRHHVPGCNVVVVDSHSTDGTSDIALDGGAMVFQTPRGGKGLAMRIAIRDLLGMFSCSYCVMIDGDFTYPAEYITTLVTHMQDGADVVMGFRHVIERGAMSKVNKFGNKVLSLLASTLYGVWVRDVCTGMWGFKREALERMHLVSDGFTLEADMFVNVVRASSRIAQIPIHYRARPGGSQTKLRVWDGVKIGWFLIKRRFAR